MYGKTNTMAKDKTVILLYGERTKQLNVRVPESKYDVIRGEINDLLRKYENPLVRVSDVLKDVGGKVVVEHLRQESIPVESIKTLDEVYDCVLVNKGIPDESDRVYASQRNNLAFYDRYDNTVFYVFWDGGHYKFLDSKEFNKCIKEKSIK